MPKIPEDKLIRFKHDYIKGLPIKIIAANLNVSYRTLTRYRTILNLNPRKERGNRRQRIALRINPVIYLTAKRRARIEGLTMARYISNLIARDIGEPL